jgi:hypothetical protein
VGSGFLLGQQPVEVHSGQAMVLPNVLMLNIVHLNFALGDSLPYNYTSGLPKCLLITKDEAEAKS